MKASQKAEQAKLRQALQIKIGNEFRLTYADIVDRELPPRFLDLLECLEEIEIEGKFHKRN